MRNCLTASNPVSAADITGEAKLRTASATSLIRWLRPTWRAEADAPAWPTAAAWCASPAGLVMCDGLVSGFSLAATADAAA
ncbi:Uncharacterised protein [Mycobacterium tuberculosis]|nr:Uncharacterised protein [Mycobacterium tuberculosis]